MSKKTFAFFAATCVSIIYGLTFSIAKDVMPQFVGAYGFIVLRTAGTTLLFWVLWLFMPKEKIEKSDYARIVGCSFFGVALNMLTFFKGLSYTSPIVASVIMVSTPIIVLILSSILLKEKLKIQKTIGIFLGLIGTVFLILYGKEINIAKNNSLGNFLVLVNAISYGFYLIFVRKLMAKYNAFTFVKWIYLCGFLMVLPFGYEEFSIISWQTMPTNIYWKIGFVVLFSTFFTYLLNLLSMKVLKPTMVAVFIYLQPVFTTIFAVSLGKDELDGVKLIAAILVFFGVYLVTKKEKQNFKRNTIITSTPQNKN
jgi:drug/metabolite transporter (DMT)-like permease